MSPLAVAQAGFTARPYQSEAIQAILDRYLSRAAVNRQVVMLPTGMGKTVVFSMLTAHQRMIEHLEDRGEQVFKTNSGKILLVVHELHPHGRFGRHLVRGGFRFSGVLACAAPGLS